MTNLQSPYAIAIARPRYTSQGSVGGKTFTFDPELRVVTKGSADEAFEFHFASHTIDMSKGIVAATLELHDLLTSARDQKLLVTLASTLRDDFETNALYRYGSYRQDFAKGVFVEKQAGNGIYYIDSDTLDRPKSDNLLHGAPYTISMLKRDAATVVDRYCAATGATINNYVAKASSSAGLSGKIKIHIYWCSEHIMHRAEMDSLAKSNPNKISDKGVYSKARKIYVQDPVFIGMPDPVEERIIAVTTERASSNSGLFSRAQTREASVVSAGIEQNLQTMRNSKARGRKLNNAINKQNARRSSMGLVEILPKAALTIQQGCERLASQNSLDHNSALRILKDNVERHGWNVRELEAHQTFETWMSFYIDNHHRSGSRATLANKLNPTHARADQKAAFRSTLAKIKSGEYVPFAYNSDILFRTIIEQAFEKTIAPLISEDILEGNRQIPVTTLADGQFISDVEPFQKNTFKFIIGGTGTGKTFYVAKEIANYLEVEREPSVQPTIILQVATVALAWNAVTSINKALELSGRTERFDCYLSESGKVRNSGDLEECNLLVISTQSLWRLSAKYLMSLPNLFYIKEEINETTSALVSDTCKDKAYQIRQSEKFLASSTTHFLGLDASLKETQLTQLLKDFGKEEKDVRIVKYNQSPETRRRSQKGWVFYHSQKPLRTQLISAIEDARDEESGELTKKFAVTYTKASHAAAMRDYLLGVGVDRKQIFLFTAKTMDKENLEFAHTNEPGIMLYSPVLAAGFDAKGTFDEHYAFISPHQYGVLSADAVEQQLGRIRHCRNERHIYSGEGSHRLTNVDYRIKEIKEKVGSVTDENKLDSNELQVSRQMGVQNEEITYGNLEVLEEMLILKRTGELTNRNVIMRLTATWQAQGIDVVFDPTCDFLPELEKGMDSARKSAALKEEMAVTEAKLMLESEARTLENKADKNEITTAAATTKKSILYDTFGVYGNDFVKADMNGKISDTHDTFIKTACAFVGDYEMLNKVERQSYAKGSILPEKAGLVGYYKQLSSLLELCGFNAEVFRKAYNSALSADMPEDGLPSTVQHYKACRPTLTEEELEESLLLEAAVEPGAGSISERAKEVWDYLKSNKRMLFMLRSRALRVGPEQHYINHQEKLLTKPKARFVPWLLSVQRNLAIKLTGFKLEKRRARKEGKREVIAWILAAPKYVVSSHRAFRKFFGRSTRTLNSIFRQAEGGLPDFVPGADFEIDDAIYAESKPELGLSDDSFDEGGYPEYVPFEQAHEGRVKAFITPSSKEWFDYEDEDEEEKVWTGFATTVPKTVAESFYNLFGHFPNESPIPYG